MNRLRSKLSFNNVEVLRYRNYRLIVASNVLSFVAFQSQNIAFVWLMTELTESPFFITLVPAVTFTPVLLLSLFGGVIADKFNRKHVVLIGDILFIPNTLILVALLLLGVAEPWHILAVSVGSGILFALSASSRQTLQSQVLPHRLLRRASSTYAVFFNLAVLASPLLSTITLPLIGVEWTLGVMLSIKAVSFGFILFVSLNVAKIKHHADIRSIAHDVADGIKFSYRDINLRILLALLAVVVISIGSYRAIVPIFVTDVFAVGEVWYPLLLLFAGCGAVVGSFIVAFALNAVDYNKHHGYLWGLGACVGVAAFALTSNLALASIFIALTGLCLAAFLAYNVSTVTVIAPDALRGRIMSLRTILIGTTPVGALALGSLTELWNPQVATLILALAGLVLLLIIALMEHSHTLINWAERRGTSRK